MALTQCLSQDEKYSSYDQSKVPFDFTRPDLNQKLPDDLYEISGITWFEGNIACIEDEHGRLYIWDIVSAEIVKEMKFAKKGDFEGIEVIGKNIYAIQSNGDLYRFSIDSEDVEEVETPFSKKNDVEGLGTMNGQLIIACKDNGSIDGVKTKNKAIYRLDPWTPDETQLLMTISLKELREFIESADRPGKVHEFDPSAIAYDTINDQLFILSADQVLVIMSMDGELVEVVFLDPKTFRQPEGICFDDKGSLFLSSEGAGAPARIYRFDRY
jgi:uncharacterized protein YjiK